MNNTYVLSKQLFEFWKHLKSDFFICIELIACLNAMMIQL